MIPVNYDESRVGPVDLPDLMTAPDGKAVRSPEDRAACRSALLRIFAETLYGEIPPQPDLLVVQRHDLDCGIPGVRAECIVLGMTLAGRRLERSAILWRPEGAAGPLPLIVGLSFRPAETATEPRLTATDVPASAAIPSDVPLGSPRFDAIPVASIAAAGYGLMLSGCNAWVPDHPGYWRADGAWPFLSPRDDDTAPGAISLWAWALTRLLDAASLLPEIDPARLIVFGHSRLGKAALWAAANDERIGRVLVNDAGCAGTSLSRRNFGETLAHIIDCYPHWFSPACLGWAARPTELPVDQHQLLACVAPRGLHMASASEDLWADPRGEYMALRAALPFWRLTDPAVGDFPDPDDALVPGTVLSRGAVAWHLRAGGHDLTAWDWDRFLAAV